MGHRTSDETESLLPQSGANTVEQGDGARAKNKMWWVVTVALAALVLAGSVALASGTLVLANVNHKFTNTFISVDLEGSKKKKQKHRKSGDDDVDKFVPFLCDDGEYSKRTLKLAYELPFASLFLDNKGQRKYEASSVVVVDDNVYAVCDSSWAISKFDRGLQPFQEANVQIGDVHREPEDSGYEGIFHDDGTFYVVRESVQHEDTSYHAVIEELELVDDENYDIKDQCSCEFEFEGDSKGFEGAIALRDLNNEMVVLGLCEGNFCSETRKNERGNGRVVVMRKAAGSSGMLGCQWNTIKTIEIPDHCHFKDYSAITATPSGRVGISSQEDSQFWVGQLLGQNENGLWDIDALRFDPDKGKTMDFPKNDSCETIYCNIEGVHWLNDEMIIAVSDKMKGKGKQDYRCFEKDQSVHVFVLPA